MSDNCYMWLVVITLDNANKFPSLHKAILGTTAQKHKIGKCPLSLPWSGGAQETFSYMYNHIKGFSGILRMETLDRAGANC